MYDRDGGRTEPVRRAAHDAGGAEQSRPPSDGDPRGGEWPAEDLVAHLAALRELMQQQEERTAQLVALLEQERRHAAERGTLRSRLVEHFTPLYLTLLGIIQGVALAYLTERFTVTVPTLTLTVWLQAAGLLLTIIFVWHQWVVVTLAHVWLPTFTDAVIPFLFGVTELAMAYTLGPDATPWLGATTLAWLMGVVITLYPYQRARRHRRNAVVLRAEEPLWPLYVGVVLGLLGSGTLFALAQARVLAPQSWVGPSIELGMGSLYYGLCVARWRRLLRLLAWEEET